MAIPVMNFAPPEVPQQPSGLLTGLMTGLNVYTQMLNAMALPGQMKAKQDQQQAQSQQQAADLAQTQAQTGLTQAQTDKLQQPQPYQNQSNIGKSMADYQNIVSTYGKDSPEAKQAQDMMTASMQRDQAMAASKNAYAQGFGAMLSPKLVREQRMQSYLDQGYSPEQAVQLAADQEKKESLQPAGMTPESRMQSDQLSSSIQKTIMPMDLQKRQYASARTEVALNSLDNFVDQGALNYTGTMGKTQLAKDKLTASITGKVSPQLEAYMNFEAQLSAAKNDVAATLAVPADQLSRGELGYLFDYSKYSSNPQIARRQYENTKKLLRNSENVNFTTLNQVAQENKKMLQDHEKDNGLQVNPQSLQSASPQQQKALGMSQGITASNGKTYTVRQLNNLANGLPPGPP